ncbi:MAG: hypothetical protein R3D44_18340 [Hyphomicrobiaceae bacterium]
MSYLNLSLVAGYSVESPALSKHVTLRPLSLSGVLERLSTAVFRAQRRRTEAEIARYIGANGGMITDDLERQINSRFGM